MLKSVRQLLNLRVKTTEGSFHGRIKDFYFDDSTWTVSNLVLSVEPSVPTQKRILVTPGQIAEMDLESGFIRLNVASAELDSLPLASSVRPVCKQYAAVAYAGLNGNHTSANPRLRSASSVLKYSITAGGDSCGVLADLLFDDERWEIRFLAVEQQFADKKLSFHILPQSVERFTWATQRIVLRALQPVETSLGEIAPVPQAAAAA